VLSNEQKVSIRSILS